jgi:hypothetical protein
MCARRRPAHLIIPSAVDLPEGKAGRGDDRRGDQDSPQPKEVVCDRTLDEHPRAGDPPPEADLGVWGSKCWSMSYLCKMSAFVDRTSL